MKRSDCVNRGGFGALEELSTDMERVFDSLLGRTVGSVLRPASGDKYVPSLDVSESDEAFEIALDLPGVKPEDVTVEVNEGKLILSGNRASFSEDKEKRYHRVERTSGSFYRAVSLPKDVDVEKIDASYEHGVLHVTLPKLAKPQPTKIQIRSSGA